MASGNPQSELSSDLVKYEGSVYSGSDAAALEAQKPEAPSREEEPRDPDLVDWDGPDDPENPYNWSGITKALQLTILAFNSFLTPLASSMFAPAAGEVMAKFGSTNATLASFVVSIYILGYCFGPLIIAPMSEVYGRVPLYHICNVFFLIFTIACAVAQTLPQLFVFRFFAGVAGVCPITIGSGTVADMITTEKRAGIMAVWVLGPLLGPAVGPVAGGFLAESEGWRWVFWVLAIASGIITVGCFLTYKESYAPVLLRRKAAQLRKETGNERLRTKYDDGRGPKEILSLAFSRPIKLMFRSPIVLLFSIYVSITYGYLYLMFTTITPIFEETYGFSQGISGLAYVGFGVGSLLSTGIFGAIADRIAKQHIAKEIFSPESRLPTLLFTCWLLPIGLFWYGWSAEARSPWIVPILGTAVFGFGLINVFMVCQTYLIDCYVIYAASVTASGTILRSLVGALLPLAGPAMFDRLGLGWGNSLLAFLALVMCGIPFAFMKYGKAIRTHPRFQLKL